MPRFKRKSSSEFAVEQSDFLRLAIQTLKRLGVPYAVVGSYASGVWGETRFTQDVDIVIALEQNQVGPLCNAFPAPEFYVNQSAAIDAVARAGQFNVIHPASGNKIDFMVAGRTDWTAAQLHRCKSVSMFPDCEVSVAAPEDVILGKLIYYREGGSEKHLRDVAGILRISGELVDRDYVGKFADELGVAEIWQAVLRRVDESDTAE
jgi:hypothetical protein